MCGVTAVIRKPDVVFEARVVERMTDLVAHRGPDDHGLALFGLGKTGWEITQKDDERWLVGLGHRRLSILDLSSSGHQPMGYRQRYWIIYNGEIYNFIELRSELQRLGFEFHSTSDTEVILAAYAAWGTGCFARLRGMWALILLDLQEGCAIFSRDRLGIKPLYLWQKPGLFAAVSEIKQFLEIPGFSARMDDAAARMYLQTGYENPARTFFQDITPLPAGTWMCVPLSSTIPSSPETFWHPEHIQPTVKEPLEAGRLFAEKFTESVRIHLRSDVPVGCALSGGLDSSSIAALIAQQKRMQNDDHFLQTFSVTFPGDAMDEREYMDAMLASIQSTSHFVTPAPEAFLEDLDRFVWLHDEPVGSFSMYAGYCIARLARHVNVPVLLNGQGGDEVFSGYWQTYFLFLKSLIHQRRYAALIGHFAGALWNGGNSALVSQVPTMFRRYRARRQPKAYLRFENHPDTAFPTVLLDEILSLDDSARRVYEIRTMFLPRLLKWEDRNSMGFSVEGRYPFLDHELIELCLSMDMQALFKAGWTKWPLRLGLKNSLPDKILWRRSKLGFEVPQDRWLNGPFRPTIEEWLKQERPIWNVVERQSVIDLANSTWKLQGKVDEPGQALFRAFIMDRWLARFGVHA
jgi:asparagine synthase (glutamine-hydrolysing)